MKRPSTKHLATRRRGHTPPFRGPSGETLPGSVTGIGYLPIGGIDQWLLVRGRNRANPPLILLHGGPGFSETCLFRHFNAPLEDAFTVVYWDQRGAAKSFDPHIPRSSMTVERFIEDLDEVVELVRDRLAQPKVTLFGHSCGSVLGVLYAARFPDKVAAYVGSGQIGDWPAAERASYAWALAEAERLHNLDAIEALRDIGPPPHTAGELWTQRTWLQRLEGHLRPAELWDFARILLTAPEYSPLDLLKLYRGFRFSLDAMWPEVSRLNLAELAPALRVPVFLFLGRHDRWVPPETSVAYLDALEAPAKQLLWFEQSGHTPFVDEPARFNASMVDLVRPVVADQL